MRMINKLLGVRQELMTPIMRPEQAALVSHLDQCVDELMEKEFNTIEADLEALRPTEERLRFAKRTYRRIN